MSSLRLALKQSLQDATTTTTTTTSTGTNTTSTEPAAPPGTKVRRRHSNDDGGGGNSSSSEENEASLNDLEEEEEDDDDDDMSVDAVNPGTGTPPHHPPSSSSTTTRNHHDDDNDTTATATTATATTTKNTNHRAAHRIQTQYRKTQQHKQPHGKKSKPSPHPQPPQHYRRTKTPFHPKTTTTTTHSRGDSDDDSSDEEEEESNHATSPPTAAVWQQQASWSSEALVQHVVSGLRVKVRFDDGTWYGGTMNVMRNDDEDDDRDTTTPPRRRRRVQIAYDDGTTEMTYFPDRKVVGDDHQQDTIVIDPVENGHHHETEEAQRVAHQLLFSAPLSSLVATTLDHSNGKDAMMMTEVHTTTTTMSHHDAPSSLPPTTMEHHHYPMDDDDDDDNEAVVLVKNKEKAAPSVTTTTTPFHSNTTTTEMFPASMTPTTENDDDKSQYPLTTTLPLHSEETGNSHVQQQRPTTTTIFHPTDPDPEITVDHHHHHNHMATNDVEDIAVVDSTEKKVAPVTGVDVKRPLQDDDNDNDNESPIIPPEDRLHPDASIPVDVLPPPPPPPSILPLEEDSRVPELTVIPETNVVERMTTTDPVTVHKMPFQELDATPHCDMGSEPGGDSVGGGVEHDVMSATTPANNHPTLEAMTTDKVRNVQHDETTPTVVVVMDTVVPTTTSITTATAASPKNDETAATDIPEIVIDDEIHHSKDVREPLVDIPEEETDVERLDDSKVPPAGDDDPTNTTGSLIIDNHTDTAAATADTAAANSMIVVDTGNVQEGDDEPTLAVSDRSTIVETHEEQNMEIDPISNANAEPTTTKVMDEPGEHPSTLTESAMPQIPSETKSDLHQEVKSTLVRKSENDEKISVDIPPVPIDQTGMIVDSQSESKTSMAKLKRPSPHTIPSESEEPPKKKLTIRIPMHKMKEKLSNPDHVTTPKSIHIHAGGKKEVTETNVGVVIPSQQPATETAATGSKNDAYDTSELSPRQLKKLALKLERKRQKQMAQNNTIEKEEETSHMVDIDTDDQPTKRNDTAGLLQINKSNESSMPLNNNTGPDMTPIEANCNDDGYQMRLEKPEENEGTVTKGNNAIDSTGLSATTSEENAHKKKKKGVRRKGAEGDSDPKSSKESEIELDDSQWVQCDECGKWRIIPTRVVDELPKQWFCRDNIYDPKHSSCDAPEQTDKDVAREKKRRLKKKQRMLKTAEEAAAAADAAASQNDEPGTLMNEAPSLTENNAERSPRPPREAVAEAEKPPKQAKRLSSMEDNQLPELPLTTTTTESRPPKKEKKLASTVKRGRSVESMDKLVPPTEEAIGAATVPADTVKPRGRGRPRRANNTTASSSNTATVTTTTTTKESIPIGATSSSAPTPTTAADDGENLEWVQCEKCDKWRKLPPHVSADDLPDVWTCNMNTWNPSSASCDAPEDKSDGLQDIGVFGTNGSAAGKLTYRHLIFGSNGRKANRPISEKMCAAESIFSVHFDEDTAPTKVLYSDSSAYMSRGRPNVSVDDNDNMSVFELMSHSNLWQELRGISSTPSHPLQPGQIPSTSLFNNDTVRMNAYTYDTLPTDVQESMKELIIRALDNDTLSGDEVVQRMQQQQSTDGPVPVIDEKLLPYCTATVIVTTLCDLVKIGTVECIQKIGTSATTDWWTPHYRRKVQRVTPINDHHHQQQHMLQQQQDDIRPALASSVSQELQQQRRRLSFPMKLSKPWKNTNM